MNPKTKLLIMVSVVGIIIVAFIFVMIGLIKEADKCVGNPFIYANKLIVDIKGDHIYTICSCDVGSEGKFYFDDEKLYKEHPLYPAPSPTTNKIDTTNLSKYFNNLGGD